MSKRSTLSRMVCRSRGLNPAGPVTRLRIKKSMPSIIRRLTGQGLVKRKNIFSQAKGKLSKLFNRKLGA